MTVQQAAAILGISAAHAYKEAAKPGGSLPAIRIGGRILVKRDEFFRAFGLTPPSQVATDEGAA
jgi:excisionase family DNA binding protein